MAPKIVDKPSRKTELAAIALDLFVEQGFESTSIAQIAKAAGIGKGTIYEYFESKESLILASLEVWMAQLEQASGLEDLDSTQPPAVLLRQFCLSVTDAFLNDPRVHKAMVSMMQLLSTNKALIELNVIEAMSRGFREMVVQILLDGVSRGDFRKEIARDAEKIAINLFAYLDGLGLHFMMSAHGDHPYFHVHEQIELYLDQLLSSIATNEP